MFQVLAEEHDGKMVGCFEVSDGIGCSWHLNYCLQTSEKDHGFDFPLMELHLDHRYFDAGSFEEGYELVEVLRYSH